MADRKLVSNVYVDGKWYVPAYPQTDVTGEVAKAIDNPAAWDGPAITEGAGDFRFTAADFGEETAPNLREQVENERRESEQADLDARAAIFGGTAAAVAEEARKGDEGRKSSGRTTKSATKE